MLKTSLLTTSLTATDFFTADTLPKVLWPRQPEIGHDNPIPFWRRWSISSDRHRTLRRLARLNDRLRRGQPIVIGSLAAPCDLITTLPRLARLEHDPAAEAGLGAAITLIVQQSMAVDPTLLEPLADIDQCHALRVDLLLTARDLRDLRAPSWTTLRALGDLGVASRVGVPHLPRLSDGEDDLRHLFELSLDGGAFDLFVASPPRRSFGFRRARQLPSSWLNVFERLRLEHGLPSPLAGRG